MKRLQHIETRASLERTVDQLFDRFVGGLRTKSARRTRLEAERERVEAELAALKGEPPKENN